MAVYTFRNIVTNEVQDINMSMSEYDDFVKSNPNLQREYTPIVVGSDSINMGRKKPDENFRSKLKMINQTYKGSMNTW